MKLIRAGLGNYGPYWDKILKNEYPDLQYAQISSKSARMVEVEYPVMDHGENP
jgi:hypothetical protein